MVYLYLVVFDLNYKTKLNTLLMSDSDDWENDVTDMLEGKKEVVAKKREDEVEVDLEAEARKKKEEQKKLEAERKEQARQKDVKEDIDAKWAKRQARQGG